MDKILGNFLTQANKDFPLDCETLDYLQKLVALASLAGNIAGDRVVLCGCEPNADGTRRSAGYVFVKTQSQPEGEVLPWDGGSTTGGMYVKQEDVAVNANNTNYPKAYTRRSLAPGYGDETYSWDEFTDIRTIKEIMADYKDMRMKLSALQPAPLGTVLMWAGANVPEGYLLCNGQQYRQADYPELYAALGTVFNNAMSANGISYTTDAGFFRVPDLRGRFVAGLHDNDNDYKARGMAGGVKAVSLTTEQMPEHAHDLKDYTIIPHGSGECVNGKWIVNGHVCDVGYDKLEGNPKRCQTSGDDRGNIQWIKHACEKSGNGMNHENRPPYYVLAYIMRAK